MTAKILDYKIKHPYVTRKKNICGGKPIIAGTRIKIAQIAIEYERMGWTPDEIITAHPHLHLAQVHDALAYYYTHIHEINADIRQEEQTVEMLQKFYSPATRNHVRVKNLHQ